MRRTIHGFLVAAIAGAALVACGGGSDSTSADTTATAQSAKTAQGLVNITSGTVIKNVTIVDTRNGWATPYQAVVINQGKIQQILSTFLVSTSGSAVSVDGTGKYLVPGFNDMHTHAVPTSFGPEPVWPLFIANGVTGIRDMAGAPQLLGAVQQYNGGRAAGALDIPQILQMPGSPIGGAFSAADGTAAVDATAAMGGNFVKVVSAFPDALLAIFKEAKIKGLTVSGHLSPGLSAVDTVKNGWHSIEHLGAEFGIQLDCSSQQQAIRTALLTGQGAIPPTPLPQTYVISPFLYSAGDAPFIQQEINTINAGTCESVAYQVASSSTWEVPTMIRLKTMLQSDNTKYTTDPNLKYVDPTTRAVWAQLSQQFTALQPATAPATFRSFAPTFVTMLQRLHAYGVASKTMTGTDFGGIWVIPGFSLHQEFAELAAAGFSPLEVLQATTLNPATYLGRTATMGTVEAGKNADLVLLDSNPVYSVAALDQISGVVNNGKYFSKAALDALKAGAAQAAAAAPLRAVASVVDTSHTD